MRSGENAQRVIERVRSKLAEIEPTLPEGVKVVTTYDRGELIEGAIATLSDSLIEELTVVSLVIIVFLWHLTSAASRSSRSRSRSFSPSFRCWG